MSQRSKDFEFMRNSGLLLSESRRISIVPNWREIPWLSEIVNERRAKWLAASHRGVKRDTFEDAIVQDYVSKNWIQTTLTGKAVDAYAMIRAYADKYKQNHPDYISPWELKARSLKREAKAIKNSAKIADLTYSMRAEGAY